MKTASDNLTDMSEVNAYQDFWGLLTTLDQRALSST